MESTFSGGIGLRLVGALALAGLVAACDDNGVMSKGMASLGFDFIRAFNQDLNDDPIDANEIDLTLTPQIEPFNP